MSEGLKLFIGGLCPETDTESLRGYFEQYGELSDSIAMVDSNPYTGVKKSRGFGFVTFKERSAYDDCLSEKKQHIIDGRKVEVKRAVPRDDSKQPQSRSRPTSCSRCKKVFLGGMSSSSTAEEVREAVEKVCGVGVVDKVDIMTDKNTNKPRGFTFVYFKDEEDIYPIVDHLLSRKFVSIGGRDVEVKPAIPLDQMKRSEEKSRAPPQPYRGSSRDEDYYSRSMYDDMRGPSSGSFYGASYDYLQQRGTGRDYLSGYPSAYNRASVGGYSYESSSASPYSSYGAGKYSYAGMMGGGYAQSPSSYGPTRGYSEYGRDRGDRGAPYHPYPRQ